MSIVLFAPSVTAHPNCLLRKASLTQALETIKPQDLLFCVAGHRVHINCNIRQVLSLLINGVFKERDRILDGLQHGL